MTRESLIIDLHNDSFGESEYQVGSSANIVTAQQQHQPQQQNNNNCSWVETK